MFKKVVDTFTSALNWADSLPFSSFEYALVLFLVAEKVIAPGDQMFWVSVGLAGYGILKAVDKFLSILEQKYASTPAPSTTT